MIIVPEVRDKLLDAWGIDAGVRVGEFTREQDAYLEYHRVNVFKHTLLGSRSVFVESGEGRVPVEILELPSL